MAATNYTPIQLYYSTTASAAPTAGNLVNGELAINITDGKLYYKDNGGNVQVIATKGAGTIGGSNTQIQFNDGGALAGNAAMVFNKATNVTTLTTLNLTNALGATYGGTAQSTYAQGDILYASAANTLAKLGIGTTNYILTSTGSVPQWVAPTSVTVQTANNLAGGVAGSVPYQSAADTTTFLAIGAANRVMTSTGSAPQWVTSLTGLTGVSSSSITNTSLTSGRVVYSGASGVQTDSSNLTFNGTTLSAGGFSTSGNSTLVKLVTIGDSGFTTGAVLGAATPAKLYIGAGAVTDGSSAGGATNTLGAVTSFGQTQVIATNANVTYTNLATLYIAGTPTAGTNVTITNPYSLYIAGGASYFGGALTLATALSTANGGTGLSSFTAGDLVYYASGTAFTKLGIGTNGQILTSTGTAPQWSTLSGVAVTTFSAGTTGFTPSSATSGAVTLAGTLATTNGGTGLTSFTANGVLYASSSSALATGSALTFDGAGAFSLANTGSVISTIQSTSTSGTRSATLRLNVASTGGDDPAGTVSFTYGAGFTQAAAIDVTHTNPAMKFVIGSTEQMRLTSTGLGIGTSSPSQKLAVAGNISVGAAGNNGIQFHSGSPTGGNLEWWVANNQGASNELNFYYYTGGTFAGNAISITKAGSLGIGTSSPQARLHVTGSTWVTGDNTLSGVTADGLTTRFLSSTSYLQSVNVSSGTVTGGRDLSLDANQLLFRTISGSSFAEKARITNGGNLLVGTTIDAGSPIVYGGTNTIRNVDSAQGGIETNNNAGNASVAGFAMRYIQNVGSGFHAWETSASLAQGAAISYTERARITSGGNFGVGISNPGQRLSVLGTANASYNAASAINVDYQSSSTAVTVPIGFSWSSSIGGQGAYWGMGMIPVSFASGSADLGFYTQAAERMRVTAVGNLLIGTTSDQNRRVQINGQLALVDAAQNSIADIDIQTNGEFRIRPYNASGSAIIFGTSPSGGGVNERARFDSVGNFGVGTTSPSSFGLIAAAKDQTADTAITVSNAGTPGATTTMSFVLNEAGTPNGWFRRYRDGSGNTEIGFQTSLLFTGNVTTTKVERARIDSSGNFLVNQSSGSYHILRKDVTRDAGNIIVEFMSTASATSQLWCSVSAYGANAANAATKVGRDGGTNRSINAGGTVNASGADYAEYMTKAGDFAVAKGDVVGINADGKLTNVFSDAVSFAVKSTDPSYVGGDTWGVGFEDDKEGLEAARQKVDRIAFAGQVPVNVMGTTPGQYIVPVNDSGAIKGIAKNEADMTLAEYMRAVGKVVAIQADGRAFIIVKVA